MKLRLIPTRRSVLLRVMLAFCLVFCLIIGTSSLTKHGHAASAFKPGAQPGLPSGGDTCANATLVDPGLLPFIDEGTLAGAGNNIDPGGGGCAPGGGADVVYSFTPAQSGVYTIGVTPTDPADLSLYVITDCSNPAGTCVAGSNTNGFDRGESVTPTLTAGTRYFIVVDTPNPDVNAGGYHFSVHRGRPANESCASGTVIDTSRLPFSAVGTTFGASNDVDPGTSCFTSPLSTRGPDVV